jgi:RimJ/RimL family protein N-acetyltransferase
MSLGSYTLRTPRLLLVALQPADVSALALGDTRRAGERAGISFPEIWPLDEPARAGLSTHLYYLDLAPGEYVWRIRVVVERVTRRVVGSVNMKGPPDERAEVELGWGIDEQERRRGYAVEAASAVRDWAIAQPAVRGLIATIHDDNLPSRRVAEKLGLERTDELRHGLPVWRLASNPLTPAAVRSR